MSEPAFHWYASADEEDYTVGPCATREQAIHEAVKDGLGDEPEAKRLRFHVMQAASDPIDLANWLQAQPILDEIDERLSEDDAVDDAKTTHLESLTDEQVDDLQMMLRGAMRAWQRRNGVVVERRTFSHTRNGEWVENVYPLWF